jgi:hypothetical protein
VKKKHSAGDDGVAIVDGVMHNQVCCSNELQKNLREKNNENVKNSFMDATAAMGGYIMVEVKSEPSGMDW